MIEWEKNTKEEEEEECKDKAQWEECHLHHHQSDMNNGKDILKATICKVANSIKELDACLLQLLLSLLWSDCA